MSAYLFWKMLQGSNRQFPAKILLVPVIAATAFLQGCATFGSAPVYGDIPECERLIPPDLKKPVESVEVPNSNDAQPWMQAFVAQTGQLDKANDRTASVEYIYSECLKLHRDALAKAKHRFLGVF